MKTFFQTIHCLSRQHCQMCRNKESGRSWRNQLLKIFKTPNASEDFECPFGVPWGAKSGVKGGSQESLPIQSRPSPTISQAKTFAQAALTSNYVSDEILKERTEICGKCKYLKIDPNGLEFCMICGCSISIENKKVKNLASYEEGPIQPNGQPKWGCKFPDRNLNKGGWRR